MPSMLFAEKVEVEFQVLLAHFLKAEMFLREVPRIPAKPFAERRIAQKFLDGLGEVGFVAERDEGSSLVI